MRKKSEMQKANEEFVKTYDDSKISKTIRDCRHCHFRNV